MSGHVIGIDPGLDGAVAVIYSTGVAQAWDTPSAHDGKKRRYLLEDMRRILRNVQLGGGNERLVCAIERVHSMPKQGVVSSFTFGEGFGLWQGLLSGLSIPFDLVEPQTWKKTILAGAGKEKDASRIRAQQIFTSVDLRLKKHHGRADALLIAEYRRRQG